MRELRIRTSEVFKPLLAPARYKGAYGGRGSGKSHFFAESLIEDSLAEPGDFGGEGLRSVCIREVQKDLAQSAKLLIELKLNTFRLGEADGFKVYRDVIQTPGDGIMIFKGMNDYTADSIKSLEKFKRGWWEEAQTATARSLTLYRPTLREDGAQRWFSWNPRKRGDPIEKLLRGPDLPTGAVVVNANWRDNSFWNAELENERQDFLRLNPDEYPHVWEGEYVSILEGAYYAKVLAQARADGRIGRVGADPLMKHHLAFDIGGTGARADAVAIWDAQLIGKEIRSLKYYEAIGQPLDAHIFWMRENGLETANTQIWLPHDGAQHDRVYDISYETALRKAGYKVEVVTNQGRGAAKQRVEIVRRMFPLCWFDEDGTSGGLDALGWYHEKKDQDRSIGLGPEHDWSSHGADAFGLLCIAAERVQKATHHYEPIQYSNRGIV